MDRCCWKCQSPIYESMGAVLARDILSHDPRPVRELCGKCVGKACYANPTLEAICAALGNQAIETTVRSIWS